MGTKEDRSFLHKLYMDYYAGSERVVEFVLNDKGKARCIKCGKLRKLGVRGKAKGKCKKCRKIKNIVRGLA